MMDVEVSLTQDQALSASRYSNWQLIKLFWQSEQRIRIYFLSAAIILMTITLVVVEVMFNYWYNYFYDALQLYDRYGVIRLLAVFIILATLNIIFAVYRFYIAQLFALRWRKWLTAQFIGRWLKQRGYYYLEHFDVKTDNPDQRIQEDVNSLVNSSLDLTVGLFAAVATFFAFIYILWRLSGVMVVPLGSWGTLSIPGYLVWVGLMYAFVGSYFTLKIGRPLVGLNFEQQRREASFRYAATDLRIHAENVALYRGELQQKGILNKLLSQALANSYVIIIRQKLLLWFTAGYNQTAVLLPLLVALPNYFDKVFMLGGLMQSMRAFGSVQDSLSFLVNSYTQIAQWRAVSQRLTTFANHLNEAEEQAKKMNQLSIDYHSQHSIEVRDLSIKLPHGTPLLTNLNLKFEHGKNYLIQGSSGIGKSTLIRTIAGVWPYASGSLTLPEKMQLMYVPQKPYMPIGTLAEALFFPDTPQIHSLSLLEQLLRDCQLADLIPRLQEVASWREQLSPGEMQRIAFARILLHKPDWVFLDESTSMLDLENEHILYNLIQKVLPHCSLVSIGHRPSLSAFHHELVELKPYSVFTGPSSNESLGTSA